MTEKILVVDDEETIAKILTIRLEREGYEVIQASEGQSGLKMAQTESPDLIILDVMLPKLDGYKVCKMLKGDERYQTIPIILLSALNQESDADNGYSYGANLYMSKPYDSQELVTNVRRLIDARVSA